MGTEIIGILIVSFFLGIKHSFDVDHVAAVSNFLISSPKFSKRVKLSITWALGHSLTAGVITVIIFFVKDLFFQNILNNFEIIVSIMLIFIGVSTLLWEFAFSKNSKRTTPNHYIMNENNITNNSTSLNEIHPESKTKIVKPESNRFLWLKNSSNAILSIGIIQGLASNDELFLVLVITLGINDLFIVINGIVIFSLGVVIGMISWSSLINIPGIKTKKDMIFKYFNIVIALLAIAYGIYSLFGGKGINLIPINI
ncbi:MAG: hypothetical protein V3V33_02940 [Candidatus Lokiarchaeia archaeon]